MLPHGLIMISIGIMFSAKLSRENFSLLHGVHYLNHTNNFTIHRFIVGSIQTKLLTHVQIDHISGCELLKKNFNTSIIYHVIEGEKLTDSAKNDALSKRIS